MDTDGNLLFAVLALQAHLAGVVAGGFRLLHYDVMASRKRTRLPGRLRPLFWDYRFASLSWEKDALLIIQRVLSCGDWQSIRWLRRRAGDDRLREWLSERRGAGLSPRQLRFWELIWKMPSGLVDCWLADPARAVWDNKHETSAKNAKTTRKPRTPGHS